MKSVVEKLNTQKFARIRIGVGFPKENENIAEYVLKKLKNKEIEIIEEVIENTKESVCEILLNGIEFAMNKTNKKTEKI